MDGSSPFSIISAFKEDALWWLQDKMLFKLWGKKSSSGTVGVWGSPQPVPPAVLAAKGGCRRESLSPGQQRVPPCAQGSAPLAHLCDSH